MHVVLVAAESLDGFISRHAEAGTAFASAEDKAWFPACLRDFDCSVMGGATYRAARAAILGDVAPSPRLRVVVTRRPALFADDALPGRLEFTDAAPGEILARLDAGGHRRCALLGGGEINGLFLAAGLVDEAWVTIEPRVFGGGRPLAAGRFDVSLHLGRVIRLGPDVLLLQYTVDRSPRP